jgi:translation elongation factor EF-1alpha
VIGLEDKKEEEIKKEEKGNINSLTEVKVEKTDKTITDVGGSQRDIKIIETVRPFSLYDVTVEDAKKFKFFADDECNKSMAVALHFLLEAKDTLAIVVNLANQVNHVQERMESLELKMQELIKALHLTPPSDRTTMRLFGRTRPRPSQPGILEKGEQ